MGGELTEAVDLKLRVAVELKGRFLWRYADWPAGSAEVSTFMGLFSYILYGFSQREADV